MKRFRKNIVLTTFVLMQTFPVFSQLNDKAVNVRFTVPEIAVVDIEPALNNVEFAISASDQPGAEPVVEQLSEESLWINYSSAIRPNSNKRKIVAQISEGEIPAGIAFFIEASAATPFGSANQGNSLGRVQMTKDPRPIISGIGSCYTGDGVNMGHELKYSIEITDFSKIESAGDQVFTVMYTISDN